jgi:hypothetical protein
MRPKKSKGDEHKSAKPRDQKGKQSFDQRINVPNKCTNQRNPEIKRGSRALKE